MLFCLFILSDPFGHLKIKLQTLIFFEVTSFVENRGSLKNVTLSINTFIVKILNTFSKLCFLTLQHGINKFQNLVMRKENF